MQLVAVSSSTKHALVDGGGDGFSSEVQPY